ncbi:MAG: hypothetical protein C0617_02695 [Desulfuromonas sp.]|uniref:M90 family metallopeptidase n=1 Tax=Desulfuromonas sp. TaxID=892 RepID=UPI000CB4B953|nr:M90 family metallopeptidase [Desulfuromonas sp.]PLX85926.1 MAG: hypothetical protein C0617_02695 [Desulfuromonas sp.]
MFFFKGRRRRKLRGRPLRPVWIETLRRNLGFYARLPESDRAELHGHIRVFLDEKEFEGCGGLQLDDEIRVTVAAQACVLLLHRKTDYYPELRSILIYPSPYRASRDVADGSGVVHRRQDVRLGESWSHGTVVLAWDSVRRGAVNPVDGHNVVFHEFAHQLDSEDGRTDGAPILADRSHYSPWARILGDEFERLQQRRKGGRKSLLDHYGATNPAEFFAVATETFFENPGQLKKKHPQLYGQLEGYYRQDPAGWPGGNE